MTEMYQANVDRAEIMKQIAINLRKLKVTMDWTQAKMADATKVSEPTMNNYLKGERLPGIDYLVALCANPAIKKQGIILSIDDFLSPSFDPERAQKVKHNAIDPQLADVAEHRDFVGTYICYYYDQSKTVHDQDAKHNRELRFGIFSVYDDYNCVTAEKKMKAYATFYKAEDLEKVTALKAQLDNIFRCSDSVANRNEALVKCYAAQDEGVYSGEVNFSTQHTFINLHCGVYNDNALMIFYSPQKRMDSDYLGGIGSIASVAHGRMHMPTAQKIIISRYALGCSFEEISDHLSLSSAPVTQTEEAIAIAEICKRLYGDEAPMSGFLDENDKTAIIEARLSQLVRNYIEKNVCCVGSVSEEEDKKVYSLIKKYAD